MKKKSFKEKVQELWAELKFSDKVDEQGKLAQEHWDEFRAAYKEKNGSDFDEDAKKAEEDQQITQQNAEKAKAHDAVLSIINESTNNQEVVETEAGGGEGSQNNASIEESVRQLQTENKELREVMEKMEEDKTKTNNVKVGLTGAGMAHSETHLFSQQDQIFSLDRRWNKIFLNPSVAVTLGEANEEIVQAFNQDTNSFAKKIVAAIKGLHAVNMLNPELLRNVQANPNLDALTNAGLGDQFVQFRVRELIARIFDLENVRDFFPVRSGVQDRDLITNAFVEEITQSWQDSELALKGESSLDPELGYVDDCMILTKFTQFKELERRYIAYLNTNGSSPVKWSMIEWVMDLYMRQAMKEYNLRSMQGIYIKPVADAAGYFLNASTGIINRILLYNVEKKVALNDDAQFATYDNVGTNFLDYIEAWALYLKTTLDPLGVDVENNIVIFANKNHKSWYRTQYRDKYGLQNDFEGTIDMRTIDTNVRIVWVPNMGDIRWVFSSPMDNLQLIEFIPGEMFSFYFERRLNSVYAQSTWKEGSAAGFAGKLVATQAELNAAAHLDRQWIWAPKPAIALAADATLPDAVNGTWFKTVANTGATVITSIDNPKAGAMYVIECGSATNASTITKAGDFSEITANWVPTTVGDKLVVAYRASTGKFEEIARVVADAAIAYNANTSPNAIGVR